MSKRAFNGQSDPPAAPQDWNQGVHDNPPHGKAIRPEAPHKNVNDGDYDLDSMRNSPTRTGLRK